MLGYRRRIRRHARTERLTGLFNVISSVGNYGQVFERYLGVKTDIGLERGVNALWTDGGSAVRPSVPVS